MYSRDALQTAREEVAALPDGSQIIVMLADYGRLRDQVRRCQK